MKKKLFPGDSFSKSDLNCFVSSEHDLKTGGEKKNVRIIIISYFMIFPREIKTLCREVFFLCFKQSGNIFSRKTQCFFKIIIIILLIIMIITTQQ